VLARQPPSETHVGVVPDSGLNQLLWEPCIAADRAVEDSPQLPRTKGFGRDTVVTGRLAVDACQCLFP
jgi:hypothetical protein